MVKSANILMRRLSPQAKSFDSHLIAMFELLFQDIEIEHGWRGELPGLGVIPGVKTWDRHGIFFVTK